ncbi:MAG: nickel-dependent hydrogenase large subunit [Coriobacteriia bacterium]|nr:nickel-dependent hydrogenase large subunit [Coriobacteriia bacterium]
MAKVIVDPVTRIEGHLRVEATVDESGTVSDATSSGTAWRGIEIVSKDRDPRDVWAFVGRICGVCTSTHSLASLRAVEDALNIRIPKNANFIRNIMDASQDAHDHLVHFYHLNALDYVSPVAALDADPAATAALQQTVLETYNVLPFSIRNTTLNSEAYPKEFPTASPAYFQAVKDKIQKLVDSGQLGIFSAHYWDHEDYKLLPPEVHLMAVSHYLNVLDRQSEVVVPQVIFGGKNPHPHYIVGGMPCSISMNDMNAPINTWRLAEVDKSINLTQNLLEFFYLPDLLAIGKAYVDAGMVDGGGLAKDRVLGYGAFPDDTYQGTLSGEYHEKCLVRSNGVVEDFKNGVQNAKYYPLAGEDLMNPEILGEAVDHAWFKYPEGTDSLHPSVGVTEAAYDGGTVWDSLDVTKKYSWIKSPTWYGKPCEVGPLAKYIVVYTKVKQGHIEPTWAEEMMVKQIDGVSQILGVEPHVWMLSTVGRTACRALDAQMGGNLERYFYDQLINNIKAGDTTVANTEFFEPSTWPKKAIGVGVLDAPRGALGHWVEITDGLVSNYQAIVPTTWNAMPRLANGDQGAYERSMMDTKVKAPDTPLEILRAIHSFDPCLACATHLYDKDGQVIASDLIA